MATERIPLVTMPKAGRLEQAWLHRVIEDGRIQLQGAAMTNTGRQAARADADLDAMAITPDGATSYVTNYKSGTVTPIRTATNQVLRAITVGNLPSVIAITPAPRR